MSMSKRLSKIETRLSPKPKLPQVVEIQHGETAKDAADRYARTYGKRPHRCLGVPEPVTAETQEAFERRFERRQLRLITEMKAISRSQEAEQ